MVVVVVSKVNWSVVTVRNVSSITVVTGTIRIVGDSTVTVNPATHIVRIMNSTIPEGNA